MNDIIPSVPRKMRDSNMELLRIVAILLVMVVHANFRALPVPGIRAIELNPSGAFLQFVVEALSVVAVNVFVLLSGWYGIRPKVTRLSELVFQVLFFGVLCMGFAIIVDGKMPDNCWSRLFLLGDGHYWFVKTYVALYLISPVLNAFVDNASRRQQAIVLVGYFVFQTIYGWWWEGTTWLRGGYSLPSFIALYLLARYMHRFQPGFTRFSKWIDLLIYIDYVALLAVIMYLLKQAGMRGDYWYFYTCTLVIVGAVYLLPFFSKLHLRSRLVNWVAASAFAAYLTQSSTFTYSYYDNTIADWFNDQSRCVFILYAAIFIAVVFVASILLDKLRLIIWRTMTEVINKFVNKCRK